MKIRGVNLGNWLVLEKWMRPDLFAGTKAEDEYLLARQLPEETYEQRIRAHREGFVTEKDFAWLKNANVNAVRLPIPYYVFGDRAPYIGCIEEVDKAFDWAEKYEMQIMLDLHTVPGSQNGFDNGGLCGICRWAQKPDEVEFVLQLLERLATRYGNRKGLWGIELVNEPMVCDKSWEEMDIMKKYPPADPEMVKDSAPVSMKFLQQFYREAYRRIRKLLPDEKYIVMHDGFQLEAWEDFFRQNDFQNVILDTHLYLCNVGHYLHCSDMEGYRKVLENYYGKILQKVTTYVPVVVGEWCIANPVADRMMDQEEKKEAFYQFAVDQMNIWNIGEGYFYWSYKLLRDPASEEKLDGWDFCSSWEKKWIELI